MALVAYMLRRRLIASLALVGLVFVVVGGTCLVERSTHHRCVGCAGSSHDGGESRALGDACAALVCVAVGVVVAIVGVRARRRLLDGAVSRFDGLRRRVTSRSPATRQALWAAPCLVGVRMRC